MDVICFVAWHQIPEQRSLIFNYTLGGYGRSLVAERVRCSDKGHRFGDRFLNPPTMSSFFVSMKARDGLLITETAEEPELFRLEAIHTMPIITSRKKMAKRNDTFRSA
jgi:hypothetical protein